MSLVTHAEKPSKNQKKKDVFDCNILFKKIHKFDICKLDTITLPKQLS